LFQDGVHTESVLVNNQAGKKRERRRRKLKIFFGSQTGKAKVGLGRGRKGVEW
jgi:hypothetical protein